MGTGWKTATATAVLVWMEGSRVLTNSQAMGKQSFSLSNMFNPILGCSIRDFMGLESLALPFVQDSFHSPFPGDFCNQWAGKFSKAMRSIDFLRHSEGSVRLSWWGWLELFGANEAMHHESGMVAVVIINNYTKNSVGNHSTVRVYFVHCCFQIT